MSILLYVASAIVVMAGAAMIGFGIPINEFSFGNTLIIAGTTTIVGGLIIFGLGAAVAQLQRVAEGLTERPSRPERPIEPFDAELPAHDAPPAGRFSFPPKQSDEFAPEPPPLEPEPVLHEPPPEPYLDQAPSLPNPVEPPAARPELPPFPPRRRPVAPPVQPPPFIGSGSAEKHEEPVGRWRPPPPTPPPPAPVAAPPPPTEEPGNFDELWPEKEEFPLPRPPLRAEPKPEFKRTPPPESPPSRDSSPMEPPPLRETAPPFTRDTTAPANETVPPFRPLRDAPPSPVHELARSLLRGETDVPKAPSEPRAVAILKSGVVDGMGYTLYVDGSIEAELPQGTLRFASIGELREHLEKSS
jgi:hypothetical protein